LKPIPHTALSFEAVSKMCVHVNLIIKVQTSILCFKISQLDSDHIKN